MKDAFLIHDILPGHKSAYEKRRGHGSIKSVFTAEELGRRLDRRASRRSRRESAYRLTLQISFVFSLLTLITLFSIAFTPKGALEIPVYEQEVVQMEEILQTRQQITPPPPPAPPVPVAVADDEVLDDEELNLDASLDINEALSELPPPPPAADANGLSEEPEVFMVVEKMPEMVGGLAKLNSDLAYPPSARKAGMEGTVVVRIVVMEDGTPADPEVLRSAGSILDEAAVEAVMRQSFTPGRQRSKPVRVAVSIPVRFSLT